MARLPILPWNRCMGYSDDDLVGLLLILTWTLITGRTLRSDVPPAELSAEELIEFWAEDQDPFCVTNSSLSRPSAVS